MAMDTALLDAIRAALETQDAEAIAPLLADDVVWDNCMGKNAVIDEVRAAREGGMTIESSTITELSDRVVVDLVLPDDMGSIHLPVFIDDDLIVEIRAVDIDSHETATKVSRRTRPDKPTNRAVIDSLSPVFAVGSVGAAMEHYRKLGFEVDSYDGGDFYAYAARDEIQIHLTLVDGVDPLDNLGAVYLFVDDADALYAEWFNAGIEGRLTHPETTDYGLREGAHIDPDGNLLRFGSPTKNR